MINSSDNPPPEAPSRGGVLRAILETLASTKLATAVGSLIVLACILGTLLPQGADVEKYLHVNPGSARAMKILVSLGLTAVFDAWWFIVLLVVFSFNVAACLIRRMSARLRAGRLGIPGWGFLLTHVSVLLILGGAVIRGAVGQKGELGIREGQTLSHFMTSRGPIKMPFDVRLVKFDLEFYEEEKPEDRPLDESDTISIAWPDHHIQTQLVVNVGAPMTVHSPEGEPTSSNTLRILVSRYVPDFVVDTTTHEVSTRSEVPRNPAIFVDIEGQSLKLGRWLFANHPDFDMQHASSDHEVERQLVLRYQSAGAARLSHDRARPKRIRSFKSTLQLLENGTLAREKTIEVNSPLSYRGYTLYQSGYDPQDLSWSTLQVVRDPGVPIVYTGFLSMIIGLILLLCFKPTPRPPSPPDPSSATEVHHYDAAI